MPDPITRAQCVSLLASFPGEEHIIHRLASDLLTAIDALDTFTQVTNATIITARLDAIEARVRALEVTSEYAYAAECADSTRSFAAISASDTASGATPGSAAPGSALSP